MRITRCEHARGDCYSRIPEKSLACLNVAEKDPPHLCVCNRSQQPRMIRGTRRSGFSFCAQKGKAGKAEEFCKGLSVSQIPRQCRLTQKRGCKLTGSLCGVLVQSWVENRLEIWPCGAGGVQDRRQLQCFKFRLWVLIMVGL